MSKSELIQIRVTPEEKEELQKRVKILRFQDLTEMILFIVFNAKIHSMSGLKKTLLLNFAG